VVAVVVMVAVEAVPRLLAAAAAILLAVTAVTGHRLQLPDQPLPVQAAVGRLVITPQARAVRVEAVLVELQTAQRAQLTQAVVEEAEAARELAHPVARALSLFAISAHNA
jgi:hypothetical protein